MDIKHKELNIHMIKFDYTSATNTARKGTTNIT
jgi:hypothetical protein